MDPYETLIHELGNFLGINLVPDHNQTCLIHFPTYDLSVQIDLDTNADQILIGSELSVINPGIYREQIFRAALRTNVLTNTNLGTLAYSEKKNSLILFKYFILNALTGEKLYHYLQDFIDHAIIWKDAIKNGNVPTIEESSTTSSGMFGL